MWNLNTLKRLSTILSLFVAASECYYAITGTFPPRPYTSLPWANEVPPDVSVINIKALKHSLRMCELFHVSSRWLSADTPSFLPLSFVSLRPSYFPQLIKVRLLSSRLCHGIHLMRLRYIWIILLFGDSFHVNLFLELSRSARICLSPDRTGPTQTTPFPPPHRHLWKWNGMGVGGVICKEDRVNLLF